MNAEETYQAERIKSEADHHTPTAAAMISHILANLFITRGIALAEKEEKFGLAEYLKKLYTWIKHQVLLWQRYLGNDVHEEFEEDDDE